MGTVDIIVQEYETDHSVDELNEKLNELFDGKASGAMAVPSEE